MREFLKKSWVFVIVVAGYFCIMFGGFGKSEPVGSTKSQPVGVEHIAPKPSVTVSAAPSAASDDTLEEAQAVLGDYTSALAKFSERSEGARTLQEFLETRSGLGVALDRERMQVLKAPEKPGWFFITVVEPERKTMEVGVAVAAAEFHCHGLPVPTLTLRNWQGISDIGQAMMISHELIHAVSCMKGEPPSAQMSQPWLLAEYDAYIVSSNMINEATGGQWMRVVLACAERRRASIRERGASPFAVMTGSFEEDKADIRRVFGDIDDTSLGFLVAQLNFETNIWNVSEAIAAADPPMLEDERWHQLATTILYVYKQIDM